jgi:hypothetical protein
MGKTGLFLALLTVASLTGCHRMGPTNHGGGPSGGNAVGVEFTPYSAVRSDPATRDAVRFYEGDKATLSKVGAQYVGELELDANQRVAFPGFSKKPNANTLAQRAAYEAAKVGATHYVLVEAGTDVNEYQVTPQQTETESVSGYDANGRKVTQSVTTHHDAKSIRTETPRGRFALFRVDPQRWNELPPALRPAPMPAPPSLAQTATTTTTSAH